MTTSGMNGPAENGRGRRSGIIGPEAAERTAVSGQFGTMKPLNAVRAVALLLLLGVPVAAQGAAASETVMTEQCQQEQISPELRPEYQTEGETDAETRPEGGDLIKNFPDGKDELRHDDPPWFLMFAAGFLSVYWFSKWLLKTD